LVMLVRETNTHFFVIPDSTLKINIKFILLPNLMHFGRKFDDNLLVFNVSILYSYICDRNLAYLDKTLKVSPIIMVFWDRYHL
jgi:hypothetical protein